MNQFNSVAAERGETLTSNYRPDQGRHVVSVAFILNDLINHCARHGINFEEELKDARHMFADGRGELLIRLDWWTGRDSYSKNFATYEEAWEHLRTKTSAHRWEFFRLDPVTGKVLQAQRR